MTCLCPSRHYLIQQNWRRWIAVSLKQDVFTRLLHLILNLNMSIDLSGIHFVSVQCENAICVVHCDHSVCDFMCVCM